MRRTGREKRDVNYSEDVQQGNEAPALGRTSALVCSEQMREALTRRSPLALIAWLTSWRHRCAEPSLLHIP